MRILFDVTKAARSRHRSGLLRVSARIAEELARLAGASFAEATWNSGKQRLHDRRGKPLTLRPDDVFLTTELFSEEERPGFRAFIRETPARTVALFHDAIPLRFPEITWPQAVARHPSYMKDLAGFDQVAAVSKTSAEELAGYWKWLEIDRPSPAVIQLGADFRPGERPSESTPPAADPPLLLQVGILEPRKNQTATLDAAEVLHADGVAFELVLAGRINPHFGKEIVKRVRQLRRRGVPIRHLPSVDDATLDLLYRQASLTLCPSIAEGFGLPVLEALWAGSPVLASDLPSHQESAGKGVRFFSSGDKTALLTELRHLLGAPATLARLKRGARQRILPLWRETASAILTLCKKEI